MTLVTSITKPRIFGALQPNVRNITTRHELLVHHHGAKKDLLLTVDLASPMGWC